MEINCPQCGKIYDIPDELLGRQIRCICRFNFRPKDVANRIAATSNSPIEDKNQEPLAPRHTTNFDETSESEISKESISETQLDDYISNLKQMQGDLKQEEVKTKANEKIVLPKTFKGTIEIEERLKPKKSDDDSSAVVSLEEETTATEDSINLDQAQAAESVEAFKSPSQRRQTRPEFKETDWRESFIDFSKSKKGVFALSSGIVLLLLLTLTIVFSAKEIQDEKPDPYLSQLLQNKKKVLDKTLEDKPVRLKNDHTTKNTVPPAKTLAASKAPTKTFRKDQSNYSNLLSMSFRADYSKLIKEAESIKLSLPERCLYLEALLLSPGTSPKRRASILQEVQKLKSSQQDSSILSRVESVAYLSSSNQKSRLYAIQILKSLQITRADDPLVYAYLGSAYEKLGKPKLALGAWNQSLTIEPRLVWVLKKKLNSLRQQNELDAAMSVSTQLSAVAGEEALAFRLMAEIYVLKKNQSAAIESYKKSIKLEDQFQARMELARLLRLKKDSSAAYHAEQALKLASNSTERRNSYFLEAEILCDQKEWLGAAANYLKAFNEDSNYFTALSQKASCEMTGRSFERAARTYQTILKRKPSAHLVWVDYGIALRRSNKLKPARAAYERSIQLKDNDRAHYELASLLLSQKERKLAAYHAKKAVALNPKNMAAQKLIASNSLQ